MRSMPCLLWEYFGLGQRISAPAKKPRINEKTSSRKQYMSKPKKTAFNAENTEKTGGKSKTMAHPLDESKFPLCFSG